MLPDHSIMEVNSHLWGCTDLVWAINIRQTTTRGAYFSGARRPALKLLAIPPKELASAGSCAGRWVDGVPLSSSELGN